MKKALSQRCEPMAQLQLREEALYGRLPLLAEERMLTPASSISAGVNAAMLGWCFLVGGYTAQIMDAYRGSIALVTGSLSSVVLTTLLLVGCNRYGCDATDLSKTCLGQRGAKVLLLVHLLCQLTWAALIFVLFATSVQALFKTIGVFTSEAILRFILLSAMFAGWLLVSRRSRLVAFLTALATPGTLMLAAIVLFVVGREFTLIDLMRIPPLLEVNQSERGAAAAFGYGLGLGFCWWPVIANLSRSAKKVRTAIYPQILTMGGFTGLMASLGLAAALIFRSADPNDWLVHMGGTAFGLLTLACLACTYLAGSATCLLTITQSLRHVRLLRRLSWKRLSALPFICLMPLYLAPSLVLSHGHILLTFIAYALTPLGCILAIDYWALRQQRINLSQIYDDSRHAVYWYWSGVNWLSLVSYGCGVVLSLVVYNPLTLKTYYMPHAIGAAPLGGLISSLLHVLSVRWVLRRRGLGGYRAPVLPQAILYYNL